jgi:hypothetical protein
MKQSSVSFFLPYFCNQKYQKFFFGLFVLESVSSLFSRISNSGTFEILSRTALTDSKNSQKEANKKLDTNLEKSTSDLCFLITDYFSHESPPDILHHLGTHHIPRGARYRQEGAF